MEKYEKPAAAKKIERIAYISFGVIVVFIAVIIFIVKAQNKKFLKEGIRVEAIINGLSKGGTTKNPNYEMRISMFTKAPEVQKPKTDTTGKTKSQKKMDEILDKLTINPNIGNYMSLTISCNSDSYNKYKPGDKIKVVYLKEDSTDVRVLSELE
ncbi:MAG: hypothetical protein SFY56_12555 [Bacteroidota bacterium]|nr:hypothetical protein [Bacteroidota bacterium]